MCDLCKMNFFSTSHLKWKLICTANCIAITLNYWWNSNKSSMKPVYVRHQFILLNKCDFMLRFFQLWFVLLNWNELHRTNGDSTWLLMKILDPFNACWTIESERKRERERKEAHVLTSTDTLTKSWNQIQRAIKNIVCISSDNSFRMFPFLVFI